ncbi:MAG: dTDP-4-dehydrorhamnose reductase [Paludibacteraceae bacterium]|nr:dTDP-4-dehydrorhamnose reductase [Paludibacteraceae bacterium]
MNILVTGANGQLGNEMRIVAAQSKDHYLFTDIAELDITNAEEVSRFVQSEGIDIVVNCAAYTNVDAAETDEERAALINATAVEYLAQAVKNVGGLLIHISTDYVFGGLNNNTPCSEDLPVSPTGAYGRTKLNGERAIARSGCRSIILRTAWLYSEFGKNFVKTMLALTATKPQLNVVFDQVGTPTYAYDLAKAIYEIIDKRLFIHSEGIYHYSNEGVCSWYDFTKMIAFYSRHDACEINPCHSSEFPSPVVRPSYSVLDKTKFKTTFGLHVPYWTDSLQRCIHNLEKQ